MCSKWSLCLLLAATALAAPEEKAKSEARTYRLQWRDLDRMVRGRNIEITLLPEIRLKGRVISVEPEGLALEISKTSDRRAYPKGRGLVPRKEVQRFRLAKKEQHTWSAVGAGIGGGIGAAAAVPIAVITGRDASKAVPLTALAITVPAALGYGLGWGADHEYVEIIVEREPR